MDRLQYALANVTPAQARLLWRLLAGFTEDAQEYEEDAALVAQAEELLARCDAAVAGE
jgi:hypothetical protein